MVISRHSIEHDIIIISPKGNSGTAEVSGQTHTLEMYHYYNYTVE